MYTPINLCNFCIMAFVTRLCYFDMESKSNFRVEFSISSKYRYVSRVNIIA